MSIKRINRTWWSKRLGKQVTKTYEYNVVKKNGKTTTASRSRRSKLIVGKNGVYKKRLDELLQSTDDIAVRADIKAKVKEAVRKGEKMSIKSLLSKISESKIEKMFINAGYTEPEILDELGISRDVLFDEDNWQGSTFRHGEREYTFVFSYVGNVLVAN